MAKEALYTKILSHEGENIECYNIYSFSEDDIFHMKVKCDFCDGTQCRCFKSIEDAIGFEGIVCSNRCFVLTYRGKNDFLDDIITAFELDIPLQTASNEVFDEIVSQLGDDFFEDCECSSGHTCPV